MKHAQTQVEARQERVRRTSDVHDLQDPSNAQDAPDPSNAQGAPNAPNAQGAPNAPNAQGAPNAPNAPNLDAFRTGLDQLKREIEQQLGEQDVAHIRNVGRWSLGLEIVGRGLIQFSFEPVGFSVGVAALSAHKALELMEIGHMTLHGCYDKLPGAEAYRSKGFAWKSPIDEASWHRGHNIRHHQYTNVGLRDPDLNFGIYRLSSRIPHRKLHWAQPWSNLLSWPVFAVTISAHVTGMVELWAPHGETHVLGDRSAEVVRAAKKAFFSKAGRYYLREFVFFPALSGPFFAKTLAANALSEVIRDVYAAATIYCGHVGAKDYPEGTQARGRAEWYQMQAEGSRNYKVPYLLSLLSGALDRQIEHHLFPKLPPNRLREIAPRVKELCRANGVQYLEKGWRSTLKDVLNDLGALRSDAA